MPKIILLSLICTLLISSLSFAQLEVQPGWKFKKIHTAHFDIIYNAEQQDLGLLYAEKLEKAHLLLAHYFSSMPEKTLVIINDKTDLTNGYATRVPYPHIMTYPVLPGPEESLADTGDWSFELLAHEYTHILTFEPATGFMHVVRDIFGNIGSANMLLPTWWKEGLAVQMETRLSNSGRLRSVYQDAVIRSFVENDTLKTFSLADINEFLPTWPEGLRPYLLGSLMWSEMVADKGDEVVDNLNQRHAGRVPYFVEEPAKDNFNRTYEQEYQRTLVDVQQKAEDQLKTLRQVPPTPVKQMSLTNATYASAPSISPNGQMLAAITVSPSDARQIKIFKRNPKTNNFVDGEEIKATEGLQESNITPTVFDGPPSGSIQRVAWFQHSQGFVYDKVDVVNRIEIYSDLYFYNLKKQKTESLTHGYRAREPAISADDKKVLFVKLSGGHTQLAQLILATKKVEILYSAALQERISYPIYLNDQEVLFSLRKVDGSEFLYRMNLQDRKPVAVLTDYPNARFASREKDPGGEHIYFTSSQNGTHNLYRADLKLSAAQPVTHTLTTVFSHSTDPVTGDIYATDIGAGGPEVVEMDAKDQAGLPAQLPRIKPLLQDRYPAQPTTITTPEDSQKNYEITDYSPGEYLWPQYWIPYLASSSSSTGFVFEAMTSGFDPLKKHTYNLVGSWDTGLNRGSLEGSYLNQQTSLPVMVSIFDRNSYFATLDNKFTDTGAEISVLPDTFKLSRYSSLQLGWEYFDRKTIFDDTKRTGPFALFSYANYLRAGRAISPETGWGTYFGAYDYIREQGYLSHSQYVGGGTTYLSSFLPNRHVFMIKVNGVYTPEKIPALFGQQTESIMALPDSTLATYVMRGYKTGQIFGKNLINTNLEYRFPLHEIYRGEGMAPYYLHRLIGAFVADGAAVDGYSINDKDGTYEASHLNHQFWDYGAEVKLETSIGYVFPISFVIGYYFAPNAPGGASGMIGTNLLIGGL